MMLGDEIAGGRGNQVRSNPLPGAADLSVQWQQVTTSGSQRWRCLAVASSGPLPVASYCMARMASLASTCSLRAHFHAEGVLAVAACWVSRGGGGSGAGFVTPIACGDAPEMSAAGKPRDGRETVPHAGRSSARSARCAARDSIALFGHSLGGGSVLDYALDTGAASPPQYSNPLATRTNS